MAITPSLGREREQYSVVGINRESVTVTCPSDPRYGRFSGSRRCRLPHGPDRAVRREIMKKLLLATALTAALIAPAKAEFTPKTLARICRL
jgi:hypothetical protein